MSRYRNDLDDFDSFDGFNDIDGISVMEELDPEPRTKSGSAYAREFVVGILLLLGVLTFAGVNWWQTEVRQSSYRLGEQAALQFNWDRARDFFSTADGYRDAGARALAASRRVQERDKSYRQALGHYNEGRWAAALVELRAVKEVQPGYRDVASMLATAEQKVYQEALAGSVAMRPAADPPGLYYRTEAGWTWLEGSDEFSTLWGRGAAGRFLYDAPTEQGLTPLPRVNRGNRPPALEPVELSGRKLMMATLDTSNGSTTLAFSALPFRMDEFSWYEWNNEGVWALRFAEMSSSLNPLVELPVRQRLENIDFVSYHVFGTAKIQSARPIYYGLNIAFLAYAPNGGQIVLANWHRNEDGSNSLALYINSLVNGENRLLYNYRGGFVKADFSPDGNYVFLTTFKPRTDGLEDQALVMLDAKGAKPPRVLMEQRGLRPYGPDMAGQVLNKAAGATGVLVTRWMANTSYFDLIDLEDASVRPVSASITGTARIRWTVAASEGSDLVLWGTGAANLEGARASAREELLVVTLSPGKAPIVARIPVEAKHSVEFLQQRGSDLVYLLYDYTRLTQPRSVKLYTVPLAEAKKGRLEPKFVRSYEYPKAQSNPFYPRGFNFAFGQGMFAYLNGTVLRALTYDGAVDVVLEDEVTKLVQPEQPDAWGY